MPEEDKRTATDILISLECQINLLSNRIRNSENLLKLLLAKINGQNTISGNSVAQPILTEKVEQETVINKDNFNNRVKTSKFTELAKANGIEIKDTDISSNSSGMKEADVRGTARGQRGPKSNASKSSVSQLLNDGTTPLFLANIEVLDENGELVNQTRTNTKGKWLMTLAPGKYDVHVSKRFPSESGKKSIDNTHSIEVFPSDGPVELSPLSIDNG
jgi:hypothetical protein